MTACKRILHVLALLIAAFVCIPPAAVGLLLVMLVFAVIGVAGHLLGAPDGN